MSFVGIVADCKDYDFIKKEIEKNKKDNKIELFNINEKNVTHMKNIKFETIIISTNTNIELNDILKNANYLVINSDIKVDTENISNSEIKIITYGLSQKATVTASSIDEEEVLVCLQRNIEDAKGNIIEVQEHKMKSNNITNKKVYSLMVVFILQELYNSKT